MQLALEKAKEFAEEQFRKSNLPGLDKKFHLFHCKFLILAVEELVKEKKINIDIDKIKIAAWLHDIRYIISKENHAEHSLKICSKVFEVDPILRDCILNYGSEGKPTTEEGKIIQLADKLCFFNPEFNKKCIQGYMEEGMSKKEAEEKQKRRLERYKKRFSDKEYHKIIKRLMASD